MRFLFSTILFFCCWPLLRGQNLTHEIEKITQGKQATVGVAIVYGDDVFTVANDAKYPVMSVFKFHIALTALKKMEAEGIPLNRKVYIEQDQIHKDTYSPMRNRFPNQRIHISYKEILRYTVAESDNNTCDWLIDFVGGIDKVGTYIKSLGIVDFDFTETEYDMHQDIMRCYNNWSTPLAVAQLMEKVYTGKVLSKEHFVFLEKTMLDCASGKDKLIAGLPHEVKFGHKTGHSDRLADGTQICDADAGVIYLPNGKKCYITVLIKDSRESDNENARIMADICRVTYDALNK